MDVSRGGKFSHVIGAKQLSRGLRRSKRNPRNSGSFINCQGAVGRDEVLQVLDELTRITTTEITDVFPFPQIFVFTNIIIVCGLTEIYEWVNDALVEKIEVAAGGMWTAVDFYSYVYLSNTKVAVARSASDGTYSETSDLPTNAAVCNFNGQVLIGAPDVSGLGASLNIAAESFGATVTTHGEWT